MIRFLTFWGVNTLLLWAAAELFASVRYSGLGALLIAGLLFGIAHAVIKPILVVLTLPVTILTLGLFLLIINALILLLVAFVVPGFDVAGFWPAVGVALFISVLSLVLNMLFGLQRR
ncbi:MAG: phage holin family protein [Gammaproteobacteria bacterium]|nr:phage holin family protein [Gammaproteobacteria bacterium]